MYHINWNNYASHANSKMIQTRKIPKQFEKGDEIHSKIDKIV